jgi:hypothetical protein
VANYVKSTNFAVKDSLLSGDPAKVIKGTEIDTEFNNIAAAVASKVESLSPTFTGTPTAPTAAPGTNNTQIATTAFVSTSSTTFSAGTTGFTPNTATSGAVTLGGTLAVANGGTGATNAASARNNLGVPATNGTGASGTWGISISGNAATASELSTASGSAPSYSARAWVNFDGTTNVGGNCTIRASGNVSTVADNGTGDYTVNFTTAMPDANYAPVSMSSSASTQTQPRQITYKGGTKTTSALRLVSETDSGTNADTESVFVAIFR